MMMLPRWTRWCQWGAAARLELIASVCVLAALWRNGVFYVGQRVERSRARARAQSLLAAAAAPEVSGVRSAAGVSQRRTTPKL